MSNTHQLEHLGIYWYRPCDKVVLAALAAAGVLRQLDAALPSQLRMVDVIQQ